MQAASVLALEGGGGREGRCGQGLPTAAAFPGRGARLPRRAREAGEHTPSPLPSPSLSWRPAGG